MFWANCSAKGADPQNFTYHIPCGNAILCFLKKFHNFLQFFIKMLAKFGVVRYNRSRVKGRIGME